jgi:hypothetical protein
LKEERDSNMELIQFLTKASTEEVSKLVSSDSNSSVTKRDFDAVEKEDKEGPSNKK